MYAFHQGPAAHLFPVSGHHSVSMLEYVPKGALPDVWVQQIYQHTMSL
jgi:hypothetical protein